MISSMHIFGPRDQCLILKDKIIACAGCTKGTTVNMENEKKLMYNEMSEGYPGKCNIAGCTW